jgi:hypothetical protein
LFVIALARFLLLSLDPFYCEKIPCSNSPPPPVSGGGGESELLVVSWGAGGFRDGRPSRSAADADMQRNLSSSAASPSPLSPADGFLCGNDPGWAGLLVSFLLFLLLVLWRNSVEHLACSYVAI